MLIHRRTELWLALSQLAAALDARRRLIAHENDLDPAELLVIAWLAHEPGASPTRIGRGLGRARQHVHRTLQHLRRRELVQPYDSMIDGSTQGWGLTHHGEAKFRALDLAFAQEAPSVMNNRELDLPYVIGRLRALIQCLRGGPVCPDPSRSGSAAAFVDVPPRRATPEWDL